MSVRPAVPLDARGVGPQAGQRLGRFQLQRVLGRGAHATVWLAHDPRPDREVAIKLLDPDMLAAPSAGGNAVRDWLAEARAVSRLKHPNIVSVFEADEADGRPYLVFEFVEGMTLAEARRGRGGMPAREAAALTLGVLDALAAAHALGIVHRDLKPSNILLGHDGRARVMDFGIAARVDPAGTAVVRGRIVGTPGYMSPEAARGEAPAPAMDLFAAGALFAELLAGAPLLFEHDPWRAVQRVLSEDLLLPAAVRVDDVLRGIVQRALARDVRERCDSARAMHAALATWLESPAAADAVAASANGAGTLEFLLRRMRDKSDFPALSASVVRIQQVAASDTESLGSLSAEILKDVALTNKLLRVVNTAQYGLAGGGGGIGTVSRAVVMVGFNGIRDMAWSLLLLEHMQDKAHAWLLQEEFLRALMAATLTAELTPGGVDREDAFLGGLLQNLGRLLAEYYFPEEAQQIRQRLDGGDGSVAAAETAARRVLGISLGDLGVGIARSWGLPESLQRVMRLPVGDLPQRRLGPGAESQRWVGRIAGQITDLMLAHEGQALAQRLAQVAAVCGPALGLAVPQVLAAAQHAREQVAALAQAMGLQTVPGSASRRLLAAGAAPVPGATDSQAPHRLPPASNGSAPAPVAAVAPADVMVAGIQDITNSLVAEDCKPTVVLRMVLETIYRALDLRCVVFCLRDVRTDTLTGRFGLGAGADTLCKAFRVPLRPPGVPDVFSAVVAKGADTLIQDARSENITARLPPWYRGEIAAASFLLLPLLDKGTPFALIYADTAKPGALALAERELSLLRTLRNQALMAFRQAER
jgi:serine/threonine protein kinase